MCFFMLGVAVWTMIEYKEHRVTLHNFDSIPEKFTEKELSGFFYTHHLHHMFPNQEYRIVIPLWHIAKVAIPSFSGIYFVLNLEAAAGFVSGLLSA